MPANYALTLTALSLNVVKYKGNLNTIIRKENQTKKPLSHFCTDFPGHQKHLKPNAHPQHHRWPGMIAIFAIGNNRLDKI